MQVGVPGVENNFDHVIQLIKFTISPIKCNNVSRHECVEYAKHVATVLQPSVSIVI